MQLPDGCIPGRQPLVLGCNFLEYRKVYIGFQSGLTWNVIRPYLGFK
ncbi:hypothetical protein HMPREF9303_0059 [Prevotella denticola CRIS 18C-A]|uniref:Uncharacterized protein n=1 Tax=Prevotella denticola CRIS 18C-A TaxID=944557 RepID=F0H7V2_9BACT|nr:hypothetical protein HMPREF9303_0059 [Prevotella denticola CRIS 18C-A]